MIKNLFSKQLILSALAVTLTLGLLGGVWLLAYEFFKPRAAAEQPRVPPGPPARRRALSAPLSAHLSSLNPKVSPLSAENAVEGFLR